MLDVLKLFGAPGSLPLLAVAVVTGLVIARMVPQWRQRLLTSLLLLIVAYGTLAVPLVAHEIADPLRVPHANSNDAAPRLTTLVVFDGDNRRGRVREAERLLRGTDVETVWVLGGQWILRAFDKHHLIGVDFRYDGAAGTTREQVAQLGTIARTVPLERIGVIVSRLQARRVAALVEQQHIPAIVVPSPVDDEPPRAGLARFVPRYIALRVSRDALYEHAALLYYRWQGWIG